MKSKISALMDGELEQGEARGALDALLAEGDARDGWRRYHLIGDLMRESQPLSAGFAARVADRIAQEPTVLAPARVRAQPTKLPLWALSAAASLSAVALVGWVAFGSVEEAQVVQNVQKPPQVAAAQEAPQVAPPAAADDYLLAHQGYSPRNTLQGVAPYVRTVSGDARGLGR